MTQEKEITIYDIAERLNISATTVSRGLKDHPSINKATRKKIHDLAQKLGYRSNTFASNLRKKRTNTIGVIVPRLISYFMSNVLAGMESIATAGGYNLIITQSMETVKKEIANASTLFNSRVDGLLVSLSAETENIRHFDAFTDRKIPLIFFDRIPDDKNSMGINIDNFKAAYEATTHLIDNGCKKIMHISGNSISRVYSERLRGYKKALADHKIAYEEKLVIINDLSEQSGIQTGEYILKMKNKPDGVFSSNDACAVNCMKTVNQAGIRIPEDIAFVGFNNDPISKVIEPNLTTINYPGYEIGKTAANLLINHLKGKSDINVTNFIVFRSELIIRDSSLKSKPKK
jgi:LacI family transcriptional regulator